MKSFKYITLPGLALLCASFGQTVHGQPVYRCGNTYSQSPCAGAVPVEVDDTRTDAQRAASKDAVASDKALAKELETSRHKDEADALARDKAVLAANTKQTALAQSQARKKEQEKTSAKKAAAKKHTSRNAQANADDPDVFTTTVRTGTSKKKSKSQ